VTGLEQRYRRVLRLLPPSYREVWEEEMVAAFLDSMDTRDPEAAEYAADYGRPSWSEVASVAALAIRLRFGTPGLWRRGADAPPRAAVWGQAVRLAALAGVLAYAVMATTGLGSALWLAGKLAWLPAPPADWPFPTPPSTWQTVVTIAGFLWLPACVGLLLGHLGVARLLAAVAVLPEATAAIAATVNLTGGARVFVLTSWCNLLLGVLLVGALAAFGPQAPPPRRRPWLAALAAGLAATVGVSLLAEPASRWLLLDWPGVCCIALVGAALVHLTAPARGRARRTPSSTLALAVLALAVLGLRVSSLLDYTLVTSGGQRWVVLAPGAAQAGTVVAVGVPLARLAANLLRRLPPVPPPTTAPSPPTR
jgi:hypothetical protein